MSSSTRPAGFIVSAFRADSLMIGDLRTAQVISVLLIAVGAAWIVRGRLWSAPGDHA